MSTYTIGSTPSFLSGGYQGSVSLYNRGPSTLYLDNDSSVGPLNGFELPPTATMEWKAGSPLWAVTASGEARLVANNHGHITDPARASVLQRLYSMPVDPAKANDDDGNASTITAANFSQTEIVEVAAYASLIIIYKAKWNDVTIESMEWNFTWYDDAQNELYTEYTTAWLAGDTLRITTPVRGSYVRVEFGSTDFATTAEEDATCTLYGTDREHFHTSTATPNPVTYFNSLTALYVSPNGALIDGLNTATYCYVPSWGDTLTLYVRYSGGGLTADTNIRVIDSRYPYLEYGTLYVPKVTGNNRVSTNVPIPTTRGIAILMDPLVGVSTFRITLTWRHQGRQA